MIDLLTPLIEPEIPTFAVLGDHDYGSGGEDEIAAALQDHESQS